MKRALASGLVVLAAAGAAGGSAPQAPQGTQIAAGNLDAKVSRRIHRVPLDASRRAHEVRLEISNNRLRDLDLAVYDVDPEKTVRAKPRCVSQSTEVVEVCRFELGSTTAWAEITATGGQALVSYRVWYRPLQGPALEGTELFGDDAAELPIGDSKSGTFRYSEPVTPTTYKHLYALVPKGDLGSRITVSLSSRDSKGVPLELRVFDPAGAVVGTSDQVANAELVVPVDPRNARARFYALVKLARPDSIFSNPEYLIAPATRTDAISVLLGSAGFDVEGATERHYEVRPLDDATLAVIVLDGVGTGLAVTDTTTGRKYPATKGLGGARQSIFVGRPLGQSPHVYQAIPGRTKLRIDVVPAADARNVAYRGKWQLSVRGPASGQPYLVDTVSREAEVWPTDTRVVRGTLADGQARTFRLQRRTDEAATKQRGAGNRVHARLSASSDAAFDIAVSNRFGQVINIDSTGVLWTFSPELDEVFLTIFPAPASPAQTGGPYELELSEGVELRSKS